VNKIITQEKDIEELVKQENVFTDTLNDPIIFNRVVADVECLNQMYGYERDLEKDLGGYLILIWGDNKEINKTVKGVLSYHHLREDEYEYKDIIVKPECSVSVTFRLFLCSSDYAVELVTIEKN